MAAHTPFIPEILTEWLPAQRWFPVKGETVDLTVVGGTVLEDPAGDAGFEVHFLAVTSGKRTDVVSVPISYRSGPLDDAAAGLIGQVDHPELGARWAYDATHDADFVRLWVDFILSRRSTPDGRLAGVVVKAPAGQEPGTEQPVKVLQGEQSNTSVVYGSGPGSMIVKFFRVLAAGESPDVQISAELTAGGSTDTPDTFGWVTGTWQVPDGEPGQHVTGHVSVLRDFVEGSTDAWRTASAAASSAADFTAAARGLGRAVARIHQQLDGAFGSRTATEVEEKEFKDALAQRIRWAWEEAGDVVGPLDGEVERIIREIQAVEGIPPLQRIHADLHLGQVLQAPDGAWLIIDFEGEPLRPTAERSVPDVTVRDVVGMVRSLEYAAASRGAAPLGSPDAAATEQWSDAARGAFLEGYAEEIGAPVDTAGPLFRALWLDKALYEVVYEIRNRPDWVEMPARDVRRALGAQSGADATKAADMNTPKNTGPDKGAGQTNLVAKAAKTVAGTAKGRSGQGHQRRRGGRGQGPRGGLRPDRGAAGRGRHRRPHARPCRAVRPAAGVGGRVPPAPRGAGRPPRQRRRRHRPDAAPSRAVRRGRHRVRPYGAPARAQRHLGRRPRGGEPGPRPRLPARGDVRGRPDHRRRPVPVPADTRRDRHAPDR
ncbi:putative trehalose synthase [Arthrobacter agilis]|nr:putative trehalose synthase [Arthrobacter agilis]